MSNNFKYYFTTYLSLSKSYCIHNALAPLAIMRYCAIQIHVLLTYLLHKCASVVLVSVRKQKINKLRKGKKTKTYFLKTMISESGPSPCSRPYALTIGYS